MIVPLLANKVKCRVCQRHYVADDVRILDYEGRLAVWSSELHRLTSGGDVCRAVKGMAYFENGKPVVDYNEKNTLMFASVYAEPVRSLKITRWLGYDNPNALTMDIQCVCGHGGMYDMKPNPFKCEDI